jgi:hypothetical protein
MDQIQYFPDNVHDCTMMIGKNAWYTVRLIECCPRRSSGLNVVGVRSMDGMLRGVSYHCGDHQRVLSCD